MKGILTIIVAAILIGFLAPTAVGSIFGADTSTWSATGATTWANLGVIVIVAFLLIVIFIAVRPFMGGGKKGGGF